MARILICDLRRALNKTTHCEIPVLAEAFMTARPILPGPARPGRNLPKYLI